MAYGDALRRRAAGYNLPVQGTDPTRRNLPPVPSGHPPVIVGTPSAPPPPNYQRAPQYAQLPGAGGATNPILGTDVTGPGSISNMTHGGQYVQPPIGMVGHMMLAPSSQQAQPGSPVNPNLPPTTSPGLPPPNQVNLGLNTGKRNVPHNTGPRYSGTHSPFHGSQKTLPPSKNKHGGGNQHGPSTQGSGGSSKHHKLSAIQKYLAGDETYQYQLNQLVKQLQDFNTQNYAQRANVKEDFNNALGKMNNQKGLDMKSMMNDYASRGMLNSGLYLGSVGDYNKNYQQNVNDLSTDQQRSLDDLINALQQYHQENSASRHNARLEAIRRRAQQYGIKS